ncbi:unnamed protein product [marine sediment metagenome]|uniref:Uncharacterized protein n=1 Tax=marine sediment metagenome TaxID=412755 RepID=X0X023_9ZZZZ
MAKFSATFWQNCSTCNFWTGPREANEAHIVHVDQNARGSCEVKKKYAVRYPTNSCTSWKKWAALGSAATGSTAPWR